MRKIIICFLALLTCTLNLSIGQKIIKATVISAPLSTTSTFAISCNLFDNYFDEMKKILEVKAVDFITLRRFLHRSTIVTRDHIDARGKLLIHLQNKRKKQICFNEFGVFFNGEKYFENKLLFKFLLNRKLIRW